MRFLFFLPILFISFASQGSDLKVQVCKWPPVSQEFSKGEMSRLNLLRYENHYALSDGKHEKAIRPEFVSKPLRSLDASKLSALLKTGKAYIRIDECSDGELTMELKPRCPGGAAGGIFAGSVIGQVAGQGAALICGWTILYGAKAVIHITAGKEAANQFDNHIVQVSLPHLYRVAENIGHATAGVGAVAGGLSPLP